MDNHQELLHRYELAQSSQYKEIKAIILDRLIQMSASSGQAELIQGALLPFRIVDTWIDDYNRALQERKEGY